MDYSYLKNRILQEAHRSADGTTTKELIQKMKSEGYNHNEVALVIDSLYLSGKLKGELGCATSPRYHRSYASFVACASSWMRMTTKQCARFAEANITRLMANGKCTKSRKKRELDLKTE